MFDELDATMKKDEEAASTSKERMMRYAVIAVASIVVFAGLYIGVSMAQ